MWTSYKKPPTPRIKLINLAIVLAINHDLVHPIAPILTGTPLAVHVHVIVLKAVHIPAIIPKAILVPGLNHIPALHLLHGLLPNRRRKVGNHKHTSPPPPKPRQHMTSWLIVINQVPVP